MSEMAANVPEDLVTRAMTGDRMAVEDVITTIRPLVVRYCRARLGRFDRSSVSADDVAQEVCLAVLTALPGYRVQGRPFLAFVYGIASHKVIDAHRAATRKRQSRCRTCRTGWSRRTVRNNAPYGWNCPRKWGSCSTSFPKSNERSWSCAWWWVCPRRRRPRRSAPRRGGSGGPAPGAGPAPQADARGGGGLSATAAKR